MKRLIWLLMSAIMLNYMVVFSDDVAVTETYTAAFAEQQGINNWYFCEFGPSSVTDLTYNSESSRGKGRLHIRFIMNRDKLHRPTAVTAGLNLYPRSKEWSG